MSSAAVVTGALRLKNIRIYECEGRIEIGLADHSFLFNYLFIYLFIYFKMSFQKFCLICFFTSHQQSFSYIGTSLPGLNQY